ncbi:MAG: UDP-N-acetylmuramoyl-tripeptide--D-alanyl-D-alanine ligase [Alphaproteobacteria bacterium]|jgi:UDP-N-acetylmuramoyl-tripeptide--D-alanyl-D-alanine ligase|nr:UDP-N-acetylmuramoyl-tripeptide--D-alanyl-D-alanine ligase [Alphaproteobacteria bacterium]
MLWNDKKLLEAVSGDFNKISFVAEGVSINTRNTKAGDVFVAIEGGEQYLDNAIKAGAVCAIVPKSFNKELEGFPLIKVDDTLASLVAMGQYKREKTNAKFIAITGSVGKTGTKNMLAKIFSFYGETYATAGNYNNHYGVPLTLANMPESTDFAVIELGMNHAGEISSLVKQVRPQVALITTVAECHIEFFNSIEDIALAKAEIFEDLKGTAVLPKDSPCFDVLLKQAKSNTDSIITFGADADISLESVNCKEGSSEVKINIDNIDYNYELSIPGEHIALNSCGVIGVLKALGLDISKASLNMKKIVATEGRGKKIKVSFNGKDITFIDETYNASAKSMIASIKTMSLIKGGRRVLVLGDMLELGARSEDLHLSILPTILENDIDKVYCCGKYMKLLFDELPVSIQGAFSAKSEGLLNVLEEELQDKDNVLTKGSHGSNMTLIINHFKNK